jgi:hypothetical protein
MQPASVLMHATAGPQHCCRYVAGVGRLRTHTNMCICKYQHHKAEGGYKLHVSAHVPELPAWLHTLQLNQGKADVESVTTKQDEHLYYLLSSLFISIYNVTFVFVIFISYFTLFLSYL